ncbi:lasso peptide biosynthesis B2 protein [Bradyrhizobium prioriisuperbiae]|uniref:lasso peptide biosynthesis B2 protein n=1 Tax=Bradyrhizobium prioriisuperbiae TaxID=2854389 RepID=UPI0028E5C363|nr:lasso peptide biosynthesis B2 protein [Bradyrhizobium prioritasuperba]
MKAGTRRRNYLTEAAVLLVAARLGVRLLSPERVFAFANRRIRRNRFAADETAWVSWAIDAASAWRWLRGPDLARALAAHTMLRRRGIASRLCLGVLSEGEALKPQAWVEVGRKVVVGGAPAPRLARLAEFGGELP